MGTYYRSNVTVNAVIGEGGSNSRDGGTTYVELINPGKKEGLIVATAAGGGGRARNGWSGGGTDNAGSNGSDGDQGDNGNGDILPELCGNSILSPGSAGYAHGDGPGAGGVIVDGQKPTKRYMYDGEGFGAGGGEDGHAGYDGVVVLILCDE